MKTFEEIKEKAHIIFNNKYEYLNLFKKNNRYYLEIKCYIHGNFEKSVSNHINNKQGW